MSAADLERMDRYIEEEYYRPVNKLSKEIPTKAESWHVSIIGFDRSKKEEESHDEYIERIVYIEIIESIRYTLI